MIRSTTPDDTDALLKLAEASQLFQADELEILDSMLGDYYAGKGMPGEFWVTDDENGPVGVAYCAPERMTEGTWNLYFIAVHPDEQRKGRGAALIQHIEHRLREQGERILLVETMGLPEFEPVRAFYRCAGYREEARIHDFYQSGQDKIVYWKSLDASKDQ